MKLDQETKKVLDNNLIIVNGVKSDFWRVIKDKLLVKVNQMDSLSLMDFENKTNEQAGQESKIRANTVSLVSQWIKEIEGEQDLTPEFKKDNEPLINFYA